MDLWRRPKKSPLFAQFMIHCSKDLKRAHTTLHTHTREAAPTHAHQKPTTALVCNVEPPPYTKPSILNLNKKDDTEQMIQSLLKSTTLTSFDVKAFLHEAGHVTHALLSETGMQHLSGTRGPVDYVEIFSHLFENFLTDQKCMRRIWAHTHTHTHTHEDEAAMFPYIDAAGLAIHAILDQAVHSFTPPLHTHTEHTGCAELFAHIRKTFENSYPEVVYTPTHISTHTLLELISVPSLTRFEHLLHYGGTYFCYPFCRAVTKYVWDQTFRENPLSRENGDRLKKLLTKGSVSSGVETIVQNLVCVNDTFKKSGDPQNYHNLLVDELIKDAKNFI